MNDTINKIIKIIGSSSVTQKEKQDIIKFMTKLKNCTDEEYLDNIANVITDKEIGKFFDWAIVNGDYENNEQEYLAHKEGVINGIKFLIENE